MNIKIIISFLFILLLTFCNNDRGYYKKFYISSDEIKITKGIPKTGESIELTYYPKIIRNSKYIKANITICYYDLNIPYTLNLNNYKGKYQAYFTIPDRSHFIIIQIKDSSNLYESYFPVLKNGEPPQGTLPLLMWYSRSYKECMELFKEDEILYPNDLTRWGDFLSLLLTNDVPIEDIIHRVDSLMVVLNKNNKFTKIERLIGYSALLKPLTFINEFHRVNIILDTCKKIINGKLNILSDSTIYPFFNSLKYVFNALSKDETIGLKNDLDSIHIKALNSFLEIENQSIFYCDLVSVLRRVDSISLTKNISYFEPIINKLFNKFNKVNFPENKEEILSVHDAFVIIFKVLNYLRNNEYSISILIRGIEFFENSVKFSNKFELHPDLIESSGNYSSMIFNLGKTYLLINDTANSISQFKKVISCSINNFMNKGPISLSCIELTKIYIKQKNLDSSEKFLILAFKMKSPFAPTVFTDYQILRIKKGKSKITISEFLNKNKIGLYKEFPSIPEFHIITDKNIIYPSFTKDTALFLFFYDDECPACNIKSTELLSNIVKLKIINHKDIVVSEINREKLRKAYGNNILYTKQIKFLSKIFNIKKLPYLVIIQNKKLIYSSNQIPNSSIDVMKLIKFD